MSSVVQSAGSAAAGSRDSLLQSVAAANNGGSSSSSSSTPRVLPGRPTAPLMPIAAAANASAPAPASAPESGSSAASNNQQQQTDAQGSAPHSKDDPDTAADAGKGSQPPPLPAVHSVTVSHSPVRAATTAARPHHSHQQPPQQYLHQNQRPRMDNKSYSWSTQQLQTAMAASNIRSAAAAAAAARAPAHGAFVPSASLNAPLQAGNHAAGMGLRNGSGTSTGGASANSAGGGASIRNSNHSGATIDAAPSADTPASNVASSREDVLSASASPYIVGTGAIRAIYPTAERVHSESHHRLAARSSFNNNSSNNNARSSVASATHSVVSTTAIGSGSASDTMQSLAIITSTAIDSGSNGRNSISRMSSSGAPRSGPISGFNSVLAGSTASVLSRVQMALLDPDGDYDLWVDEDDEESWESDIDIDAVLPLPQGTVLAPASPDAAAAAATVAASAEGKSSLTSPASKRANGGKGSPAVGQDGDTKIKRMTSTGKPLRKMSTKRKRSVKKRVGGTSGSSLPAGTPAGGIANTSSTTIGDGLPSKPAINAASRALAGSKQARSSVLVTAFRGTQSMMRRAMVLFPQHGRVSPMVDDASILSPPETLNSSHMGGSVTHDEHRHTDLSGSKGSSFTGNIASQTLQSSVGVNIHPPDMPSQLPSSAPSHAQFDTHLDGTLTSQINPSTLYFGGISPIREEASRSTTKSGTPDAPMGALFGRDVNAGGAGRQPPTVNAGPVARRTGTSQQDAAVEITPSEQETMPSQPSVPAPAKRTIWNLFGLLSFFGGSKQDKSLKQAAKTPPGKPLLGAARIAPADLEAKQPLPTVAAPTPAMQSTHTSVHGRHHSQTPAARPASLHGRRPSGASPLSGVPILATPFNSDDSDNQFMGMDSTDASNTNIDANADRKGSMSNRRSTTDKHVPKIDVIFPTSLPYASGSALPPPPAISTYFNTHLGTSASQGDTFPRQSTYSMMDGGYIATQTDPSAFPSCNTLLVESTTTGFSRSTGRSSAFEGQYLGHHLPQQHPQQHLSQGTFGSSIGFQGHQLGGPPPNTPLQPLSRPASSMLQGQGSWNQKQFQGQRSRPSQHRRSQSAMSSKSDLAKQRMDIYPLVAAAFGLTSQVLGQPPSPMQVSPQQMSAMPIQTKGTQGPQSASAGQPPGQQGGRVSVASAHPPTIQTQLQQSQQQQPSPSSPISHTAPIVSYDTRSYSGPRASVAASEGRGRKMSLTSSINSTNDSGLIRSILKSNPDAHVVEHRYTEDTLPSDSMEGMHAQFGWVG